MGGFDLLPDFGCPLADETGLLGFFLFSGPAAIVLPRRLALAQRPDGTPGLRLAIVKGADGNYAALDLEVAAELALDQALAAARRDRTGATVRPADIDGGFAHLVGIGEGAALPEDATEPAPLGAGGSGFARWIIRLSAATGEMIRDTLQSGLRPFGVRVAYQIQGVAARAPVRARFDPTALVARLSPAGQALSPAELTASLSAPAAALGITLDRACDQSVLAPALADRLLAAMGTLGPLAASNPAAPPAILLRPQPQDTQLVWDLSQAAPGLRCYTLALQPLDNLGNAPGQLGAPGLVTQIAVPPLDLGWRTLQVFANLPANRVGVPALGVTITLPAAPPVRPSESVSTIVLSPPGDQGSASLQTGMGEALSYTVAGFAVVSAGGVHQYQSAPRVADDSWVQLQASDFPIDYAHLTATDRLLQAATLTGQLAYTINGRTVVQAVILDAAHADLALAVPAGSTDARLALVATPQGGVPHAMPTCAPGRLRFDLASFPGYGPQRIAVSAALSGDDAALALELLADQDGSAAPSPMVLTASDPASSWGYAAASPFLAGFRYRVAGGEWSDSLSPLLQLTLDKEGRMPKAVTAFTAAGTRCYADPAHPGTVYYLPPLPVPERDAAGRPSLMLVHTSGASFLQLGAHFALPAGGETATLASVAAVQPAYASARLQPAPISVTHAAVTLADRTGAEQTLAGATPSGFPPYAAVWNASLTPDQATLAIAAVRGGAGLLFVDYTVSLTPETAALLDQAAGTLRMRADVASWFPAGSGDLHIRMAA